MEKHIVICVIFLVVVAVSSHPRKNEDLIDRREDGEMAINQKDSQNVLKSRVRRSDPNPDDPFPGPSTSNTKSWGEDDMAWKDRRKDLVQVNAALVEIYRDKKSTLSERIEEHRRQAKTQTDKLHRAESSRASKRMLEKLQNTDMMKTAKMQYASGKEGEGHSEEMQDATNRQEERQSEEMQDATNRQEGGQSEEMKDATNRQEGGQSEEMQDATKRQEEAQSEEMQDATNRQEEGQTEMTRKMPDENSQILRKLWEQYRKRMELQKKLERERKERQQPTARRSAWE